MALIIEDGTGVAGANSYDTVAEIDAFWAARGQPDWAGEGATEGQKEGYAIQAADWLNAIPDWRGDALSLGQTMALPTSAISAVPDTIKQAQAILAREAKAGNLTVALGSPQVASERESLAGVGETEVTYVTGSTFASMHNSTVLGLLRPWVRNMGQGGIQTARILYG